DLVARRTGRKTRERGGSAVDLTREALDDTVECCPEARRANREGEALSGRAPERKEARTAQSIPNFGDAQAIRAGRLGRCPMGACRRGHGETLAQTMLRPNHRTRSGSASSSLMTVARVALGSTRATSRTIRSSEASRSLQRTANAVLDLGSVVRGEGELGSSLWGASTGSSVRVSVAPNSASTTSQRSTWSCSRTHSI